jgi:polyhydroxyalkanoate synthase
MAVELHASPDAVPTLDAHHEPIAERALITAMAFNPLVSLDPTQLVAAAGRVLARAAMRPREVAKIGADLGHELVAIVRGTATRAPEPADKRWSDAAFRDSGLYRRWMQAYLAWRAGANRVIDEIGLDAKSRERGRFAISLVTEALAPTNTLLGNPAALRRVRQTHGGSLAAGVRNIAHDLRLGGFPSQVDPRQFRVGETLAITPGEVVLRTDVLELIQYRPTTPRVFERPLLVIPPQINKYYVLDLAPSRSLIEYAVQQGTTVFVVSWRNATPAQRDWNLGTYVQALLDASDVVLEITGQPKVNLLGVCAGGITTAVFAGHLAAKGDDRIGCVTFMVTVLDTSVPSAVALLASEKTIASSLRRSQARGVLSGVQLGRAFALLRPNDLIWNYWVNDYLLGKDPPAFDILYWNNDATNLPAALHADFLALYVENSLCSPGALEVLGTKIDLGKVTADVFAVGALTDHITPWNACYRTPQLFGGAKEFVASSSGHIQALVNPPPAKKSRYFTNDTLGADAKQWLAGAQQHDGTWWTHWAAWLHVRSGAERTAIATLGSAVHPPVQPAPGRYVLQRAAG